MTDFKIFMHDAPNAGAGWPGYLDMLARGGHLQGGSAIGHGATFVKKGVAPPITAHLTGFIRIGRKP
jgi:hypothetical protein